MADKKGVGHAYNVDFLNVVFAAASLFLFLSVVWMVWDDFDREWKNTQRRFAQLEYQVTQAQLQQAGRGVDKTKLQQLEAQEKAAQQNVKANQKKVDELQDKVTDADNRLFRATGQYQSMKATYDQDRYDFEASRANGLASAAKKGQTADAEAKQLSELNLAMEKADADKTEAQKLLGQYTGQVAAVQKQIDELTAEQTRLRKRLDVIAPSALKDYFLNAPLLDFLAPTIKIQQVILPNVVDDVNFIHVPKMDRCQTCHLAIDKKGYEKYPQPFTTHPDLTTYLGGSSAHPIDKTGCTVCHEGMGQSVSFLGASHTPSDAKQRDAWEKKYGWEQPESWDFPMLPTKMTQASCAKCHKQEIYIPKADSLNLAYATFERAGCYACHKTKGFENVKKPGPILTKIDSKLSPDWVKNWIRNPRAVKPTTWMPRFFYNSNNSSPADAVRNETEINAIAAYLFANSEKHEFAVTSPPRGDAKNGEEIVKSVGCQGCHVVGEGSRESVGPRRTFGQPLENIGNKTTYEWIYNWVRDPKHYSPATYMPNLRLTDQQVADVATFLTTLKGADGRCGEGDIRVEGHRRCAARLPEERDAVRGRQGAIGEDDARAAANRSRPARHQPLRLLQLPRHQGLREGAADRHRPLRRGEQAGDAPRFRVRHRHPAHVEDGVVQPEAPRAAHLRQGARAAAAREAAHAELRLHRRGSRPARHRDHELPARDSAAGGDADAIREERLPDRGAHARASAQLRRLSHD